MYAGKLVFAQVMECAPWHTFRRLVAKYGADFNVRSFTGALSLPCTIGTCVDLRCAVSDYVAIGSSSSRARR